MAKSDFILPIATVIVLLFGSDSAFAQCGLEGTPPCPIKPSKRTTTNKTNTKTTPKKTQTKFVPRAPKIELVKIPAGSYMMGSDSQDNEKPVHRVNIKYSFYLGKYEVTQAQWKSVMGNNPSNFKGDNMPVEQVSWNAANEFIGKLNQLQNNYVYRLPSEAEWEYACRAGTTDDYYGRLDDIGWHYKNSENKPHPVGTKLPNSFGLYDMSGNVFEWVEDIYTSNYRGLVSDGTANLSVGKFNSWRVIRGGAWNAGIGSDLRSAVRYANPPDGSADNSGFRLAARLK
jgi:formylglycine-generating enzyme required for sulfatase activity